MKPMVLGNLSYGLYALGVQDGTRTNACIVSSLMQITKATPSAAPLVALSLNQDSFSCECVETTGVFSISVLSQATPAAVIGALGYLSGRGTNKLENIRHRVLHEGVPVIKENTCCWFLCRVKDMVPAGGQKLFIAEIIAGSDEAEGTPMTYDYYLKELGGAAPKKAPGYLPPAQWQDRKSGEGFICSVCGYVYNDPNFGFEELPGDWTCPICGMPKKAFVRKK